MKARGCNGLGMGAVWRLWGRGQQRGHREVSEERGMREGRELEKDCEEWWVKNRAECVGCMFKCWGERISRGRGRSVWNGQWSPRWCP